MLFFIAVSRNSSFYLCFWYSFYVRINFAHFFNVFLKFFRSMIEKDTYFLCFFEFLMVTNQYHTYFQRIFEFPNCCQLQIQKNIGNMHDFVSLSSENSKIQLKFVWFRIIVIRKFKNMFEICMILNHCH